MNSTPVSPSFNDSLQIASIARWDIYYRLQELSIPCSCKMGQPLQVSVQSPHDAIQVWSVVKQVTSCRQDQIAWLKTCWRR